MYEQMKVNSHNVSVGVIRERINFGFDVVKFSVPLDDVIKKSGTNAPDIHIGHKADIYYSEGSTHIKVFGGVIYRFEVSDNILTIYCESHGHSLGIRNSANGVGATTDQRSVIYAFNRSQLLRLTPASSGLITTYTSVLNDASQPNQTLSQALIQWTKEDTTTKRYFKISPDGEIYGNRYSTINATLIPNNYLVSTKLVTDFDNQFNRSKEFYRAWKDGDLSSNVSKAVSAGYNYVGTFTASEDYDIMGVTFAINNPTSQNFDLYLETGGAFNFIFKRQASNIYYAKDFEFRQNGSVHYRTLMFDDVLSVQKGVQYKWVMHFASSTGNCPDGKFSNVFNLGSKTKDYSNSLNLSQLEVANKTDDTVVFETIINQTTLNYQVGQFVSLNALGRDELETPTHIVTKEIDFKKGTIKFTAGTGFLRLADLLSQTQNYSSGQSSSSSTSSCSCATTGTIYGSTATLQLQDAGGTNEGTLSSDSSTHEILLKSTNASGRVALQNEKGNKIQWDNSTNPQLQFTDSSGTLKNYLELNNSTGTLKLKQATSGQSIILESQGGDQALLNSSGDFVVTGGNIQASNGDIRANNGNLYVSGNAEIDGALNHDGTTVGLFGVAPTTRQSIGALPSTTGTLAELWSKVRDLLTKLDANGFIEET